MPKRTLYIVLSLVILSSAIFFRSYDPEADVAFDIDFSQGTNTDWSWYLNQTLARVGAANLDPALVPMYDRIFITSYSVLFFKIFGHSLKQMTLLNLFPGLLVVILLGMMMQKVADNKSSWTVMWLSSCNFILVMFSRSPLIYIWMCVFSLLVILLWQLPLKWEKFPSLPKILTVLLLFGLAMTYKSMVLFFLPCLLLAQILANEKKIAWKKHASSIVISLVCLALFCLLFRSKTLHAYYTMKNAVLSYFGNFSSLPGFCQELWRFWRVNTTFFYSKMPLESFLAYLSCFAIAWAYLQKTKRLNISDYYMAIVFVLGNLAIVPFGYSPLRYFLFVIPPTIYLAVRSPFFIKRAWLSQQPKANPYLFIICSILWISPLVNLLIQLPLQDNFPVEKANFYILGTLIFSITLGLTIFFLFRWLDPLPPFSKATKILLPVVFVFLMSFSALLRFGIWANKPAYTLRETKEDLEQILPSGAVLVGPYANLLAFNSNHRAYLAILDDRNPASYIQTLKISQASHLTIDTFITLPKYNKFLEANPDCILLDNFYIRGFEVNLYRLPSTLNNTSLSLYEEGILAYQADDPQKANHKWQESQLQFPRSASSSRALLRLAYQRNAPQSERDDLLSQAIQRNPDHPLPWLFKLQEAKQKNKMTDAYDAAQKIQQLSNYLQ